ncbi:MAG: hypothetical protein AB7P00_17725 [Sandaracinaceae bacterium]
MSRRVIPTLAWGVALSCISFAACNATAGVPIRLTLALESLSVADVTTPTGWDVHLDEAVVLLGPIYAYAPIEEGMAALTGSARRILAPPIARAHGGFDPLMHRIVRAEYLEQFAFDALSPDVVTVGEIDGLLGAVDELSVVLDAPLDANELASGPTHAHHLWVHGTATREDRTISFEGGLDLEDVDLTRRVDGIGVDGPALNDGATLVVGVDPTLWLAEADFTALAEGGDAVVIDPESQPHRAWRLGARTSAAYAARTMEGPTP